MCVFPQQEFFLLVERIDHVRSIQFTLSFYSQVMVGVYIYLCIYERMYTWIWVCIGVYKYVQVTVSVCTRDFASLNYHFVFLSLGEDKHFFLG